MTGACRDGIVGAAGHAVKGGICLVCGTDRKPTVPPVRSCLWPPRWRPLSQRSGCSDRHLRSPSVRLQLDPQGIRPPPGKTLAPPLAPDMQETVQRSGPSSPAWVVRMMSASLGVRLEIGKERGSMISSIRLGATISDNGGPSTVTRSSVSSPRPSFDMSLYRPDGWKEILCIP